MREDIKNNVDIFDKYITSESIKRNINYCDEIKEYIKQEIIEQINRIEQKQINIVQRKLLISPPISPSNRSNMPLQSIPEEENRKIYSPRNCMEWVFDLALL